METILINSFDGEGVDSFLLKFLDSAELGVGLHSNNALDVLAMQSFDFGYTFADTRYVDLTILSNHTGANRAYAIFHEINFIPEPSTMLLLTLGIGGLVRRSRNRK